MYDSIIVATDGSDCARAAGKHALTIAEALGSTVHVLSVVDPSEYTTTSVGDVSDIVEYQRQQLAERAQAAVETIASEAAAGLTVNEHVLGGVPHEVISEFVDHHDVDLVAIGTHGRTGIQRQLLGSVAEKTIRTVPAPVLTIRGNLRPEDGYQDILVPTDGSTYAQTAMQHANALSEAFGADLHALFAGSTSDGDRILSQVQDSIDNPIQTVVRTETPHRAISEYATENDIDLVSLGTHGRTGLQRHLLGSVTERTIRTSHTPVLAVHLDDQV